MSSIPSYKPRARDFAAALKSIASSVELKNVQDEVSFVMELLRGCGLYMSNPSIVSKYITNGNVEYRFIVDGCVIIVELILKQRVVVRYTVTVGGFTASTNFCYIEV